MFPCVRNVLLLLKVARSPHISRVSRPQETLMHIFSYLLLGKIFLQAKYLLPASPEVCGHSSWPLPLFFASFVPILLKLANKGAGVMTQGLRELAVLAENPGSDPSTGVVAPNHPYSPFQGICRPLLISSFRAPGAHAYMQAKHSALKKQASQCGVGSSQWGKDTATFCIRRNPSGRV